MSATGGLSEARDMFAMVKPHLRPKTRQESSNLRNADIEGKLHRHKFHFIHYLLCYVYRLCTESMGEVNEESS